MFRNKQTGSAHWVPEKKKKRSNNKHEASGIQR